MHLCRPSHEVSPPLISASFALGLVRVSQLENPKQANLGQPQFWRFPLRPQSVPPLFDLPGSQPGEGSTPVPKERGRRSSGFPPLRPSLLAPLHGQPARRGQHSGAKEERKEVTWLPSPPPLPPRALARPAAVRSKGLRTIGQQGMRCCIHSFLSERQTGLRLALLHPAH